MGAMQGNNGETRWRVWLGAVTAVTASMGLLAAPSGCSDDVESAPPGPTVTTSTTTTSDGGTTTTTTESGGGGMGGTGGQANVCPDGGFAPFTPTPESIGFEAVNPIPQGEQLLYNVWEVPDSVYSLTPDGVTATEIFRAWRVWSMGATNGGDALAFACGDPQQVEHYGISVGDAIQHTWLYDFANESATVLADGRINDECHRFSADDTALYVCRRYDWQCDPEWYATSKGYRIGRIALPSGDFSFITEEADMQLDLHPQPNGDQSEMLFTRVTVEGGQQSRAIMQMALPDGAPTSIRANANAPLLSPDGQRYLYVDYDQNGWLFASDLDGGNPVLVVESHPTSVVFSPDGTRVAYLTSDDAPNCSHIETVAVDGSEAQGPTRLRDCGDTGEFITELLWIVRP